MTEYIVFFGLLLLCIALYVSYLLKPKETPKLTPTQAQYIKCESPIERKLFNALTFNGYTVYTQHKVGKYRGDLFIPPNLIIECDGKAFHTDKARDRRRDAFIKKHGYQVIRFSGSWIHRDISGVVQRIEKELNK